ncbi:MAG TPA: DUF2076 family protein [Burkholderiales bacterium]|nr:DUF2076 family protein [Burkholderiales bacterium]
MTPQERELLSTFLQQLAHSKADPKDAEADAMIRNALSRQPDAEYLLVQRALGLELASKALQAQVEKLQAELDQGKRGNGASFLGNAGSWGRSTPATNAAREPLAASPQLYGKGPAAATAAPSAWGSGMLSNLATTAAGVVAGSFLYQGIQQLMGHHQAGSGFDGNSATQSASNDSSDALTGEEISSELDDPNDSLALDDGGFDSPDLG